MVRNAVEHPIRTISAYNAWKKSKTPQIPCDTLPNNFKHPVSKNKKSTKNHKKAQKVIHEAKKHLKSQYYIIS